MSRAESWSLASQGTTGAPGAPKVSAMASSSGGPPLLRLAPMTKGASEIPRKWAMIALASSKLSGRETSTSTT